MKDVEWRSLLSNGVLFVLSQKVNGSPFETNDAGFALAYAVIMLNTDQHNHNVRKQNIPMTVEVSVCTKAYMHTYTHKQNPNIRKQNISKCVSKHTQTLSHIFTQANNACEHFQWSC